MHADNEPCSQNISLVFEDLNRPYQGPSDVLIDTKNNDKNYGSMQSSVSSSNSKSIRILTYNFYLRPPWVDNGNDDFKNERVKELKNQKIFEQFDIICFQEVFGIITKRRERIIKYAMQAGMVYAAVCPDPSFFSTYFVEAGLLILSRYPIVEQDFFPFCYGVTADAFAYKGILYAKIEITDGIFCHIFNVHTQASHENMNTPYYVQSILNTRYDQLIDIQEAISLFLKKYNWRIHEKVLLVGDFNIDYNHHLYPISYFDNKKIQEELIFMMNNQYDEYNTMLKLLSLNFSDQIIN